MDGDLYRSVVSDSSVSRRSSVQLQKSLQFGRQHFQHFRVAFGDNPPDEVTNRVLVFGRHTESSRLEEGRLG